MAILLREDGTTDEIKARDPDKGIQFDGEAYVLLDCEMIQVIYLDDGRLMLIDEEGKLRQDVKPVNLEATRLFERAGGMPGDVIVGPVLILNDDELK